MNLAKLNEEVFIASDSIVKLGWEQVIFLKQQAANNRRKRARICAHKTNDDPLHEMLIAISAGCYIHPHRHLGKSESFHIVEGELDLVVFNDDGMLLEVIQLGSPKSGRYFFHRLSDNAYHTLIVRSDFLILHEVTNGPFNLGGTVLADFAPSEDLEVEVSAYIEQLSLQVSQYLDRVRLG